MNDEMSKCYELLGVAPGASPQELKAAHRDLAKVWHPDRFAHDPRLQQKAQEKLKEINEAYDLLRSGKAGRRARDSSATNGAETHPPGAARRVRWQLLLLPALVSVVVFFAAFRALIPPGKQHAQNPAQPTVQEQPQGKEGQRSDRDMSAAADESTRGKRADQQLPKEAKSGGTPVIEQEIREVRPLPTVTVTIDPVTGMIATLACPVKSRMTYPAGAEPRQNCNASHRTDTPAQPEPSRPKESRLKTFAKRLAAPAKLFGGRGGSDAGKKQEVKSSGSGDGQNR